MSAPPPPGLTWSAAMPLSSVAIALTVSRAASLPVKPNAQSAGTRRHRTPASSRASPVRRDADRGRRAPPRPPFSSLVNSTTRTVRRGRRFSFFISRSASHVTMQPPPSSLAPVPTSQRVEVPADDHDLIRVLAAADLANHVRRFGVGFEMRLHLAGGRRPCSCGRPCAAADRASSAGDRRGRNLRRVGGILQAAGMRRPEAGRPDGAHQRRRPRRGAPRARGQSKR